MRIKTKCFHFLGSIKKSIVLLLITVFLILMSIIYAFLTPNDQFCLNIFTIIISITSGFIVCLFSAVINRYVGSLEAYNEILRLQREITTYLKSENYNYKEKSVYYTLYQVYNHIILLSGKLMYKSDYNTLCSNLYNMLSFINEAIDSLSDKNINLDDKQKQLKAFAEQLHSFRTETKVEDMIIE